MSSIDLLMFFGPFLLGGIFRHALGDRRPTAAGVVSIAFCCLFYECLAFVIPVRSFGTEVFMCVLGTLAVMALMCGLPIRDKSENTPTQEIDHPRMAVILLPLFPLIAFTPVTRASFARQMSTRCDGVLTSKYQSKNHNMLSFAIKNSDGTVQSLEHVDKGVWDLAVEGRSHLTKTAWSAYGTIDGTRARFVPSGSFCCFGPFSE